MLLDMLEDNGLEYDIVCETRMLCILVLNEDCLTNFTAECAATTLRSFLITFPAKEPVATAFLLVNLFQCWWVRNIISLL